MLTTARRDDAVPAQMPDAPERGARGRTDEADVSLSWSVAAEPTTQRHGYRTARESRLLGSAGSMAVFALAAAAALVALNSLEATKKIMPPPSVTMIPLTSPERPQPKKSEPQKTPEKQVSVPAAKEPEAIMKRPLLSLSPVETPAVVAPNVTAEPKPQILPVTPPPPPSPAPPAPVQATHGPDKWEGRVLARLERFRHYPSNAQHARQQGTAYLRFRIDREGHVLSSSLERSSGNAELDAAAMDTLRKADPLPKIPADRPDQIELVVPIEFSISR